ncbi:hypothetical protein [Hyphomicrobium sp.]|uniref:hypothetical protein n=1 Tax=Hyphomicrobium sp. TaxID=82 RepID=UPI001D388758|nr:hypothetical protein [Hyphomicrobium sp.]MBY0558866.1 hypothetical protein [Hyphomicrobium sp.]
MLTTASCQLAFSLIADSAEPLSSMRPSSTLTSTRRHVTLPDGEVLPALVSAIDLANSVPTLDDKWLI